MSLTGIILLGLLGLVLGSAAWTIALLHGGPLRSPFDEDRVLTTPWVWLPLWGLGFDRSEASRSTNRPGARTVFELAVAFYLALIAARTDDLADIAGITLFSLPLLVALLVDWWTRIIYTNLVAAGTVLALVVASLDGVRSLLEALGGLAAGAAVFGAFYVLALLLYRDIRVVSLGVGDVFLAGMIGAMTGSVLAAIGTLFYGILLAALGALLLLATRRGSQAKALPSGSYLCAGALIGLTLQVW